MPETIDTLGQILPEPMGRDAVHISVISAVAESPMLPSSKVSYKNGYANNDGVSKKIGIVDPYLDGEVQIGQRFWIFLFPRKVTSLRHVWVHPDIKDEGQEMAEAPAPSEIETLKQELAAIKKRFADPGFEELARQLENINANAKENAEEDGEEFEPKTVEDLVDLNCLQCYGY